MRLVLKTAPTTEPLSAADVRAQLGLDASVADATIDNLVTAARQMFDGEDGWLGRALVSQTWQMILPGFYQISHHRRYGEGGYPGRPFVITSRSGGRIRIPLPPLKSLTSIKYTDQAGTVQTLDPSAYRTIPGTFAEIVPAYGTAWPVPRVQDDAVIIEFVAGYGDTAADVPGPLRQAIALQVASLRSLTSRDLAVTFDRAEGVGEKRYNAGAVANMIPKAIQSLISGYRVTL